MESYAKVFDEEDALDKLEGFASEFGPAFYGLPLNQGTLRLNRTKTIVPSSIAADGTDVIPFHAKETLAWSVT